jgi:hypothetical protein
MIEDRTIRFGDSATEQFRLHPRQVNNQFWNRLSADPLSFRGPNAANHADLVYRQFVELATQAGLGSDDELFIATPATTTSEQLGLLLGIAAEARVSVAGLVDSGLVASVVHPTPKRVLHIDVFLHRAVVTEFIKSDGLTRQRVEEIAELGLVNLLEAWANVIADRFVRDARFDPLSIASTDQQLYNQLYAWLRSPARATEFNIDIEHRGSLRRAELGVDALVDKVAPRYRMLDRHVDSATLFLSHRAARLPGLAEHLSEASARVVRLDRMDLFRGLAAHQALVRSDPQALRLITRLPVAPLVGVEREPTAAPTALRLAPERPTHLLFGSDAVAIGAALAVGRDSFPSLPPEFPRDAAQLVVGSPGVQLRLKDGSEALLDGVAASSGAILAKGSELDIAGVRFLLIQTRSAS